MATSATCLVKSRYLSICEAICLRVQGINADAIDGPLLDLHAWNRSGQLRQFRCDVSDYLALPGQRKATVRGSR